MKLAKSASEMANSICQVSWPSLAIRLVFLAAGPHLRHSIIKNNFKRLFEVPLDSELTIAEILMTNPLS